MRGVSIPIHQYSTTAIGYLQPHSQVRPQTMQEMTFACRAFTRVVLRLRVQAEMEAMRSAQSSKQPTNGMSRPRTLSSSAVSHRAPSKWSSQTSISVNMSRPGSRAPSPSPSSQGITRYNSSATAANVPGSVPFHSPLFRLRRAPLLHVFVPSPDGDWLSDASILECEAELKRAGVTHLLRAGDVVWDVAVGDEANIGRLVWDGNYLIDLDFTYSSVGDAPRYLPTLAFPPSYFHRVIRTMGTGNPIVRIDISPWADQIHANMQLIQDKMRTDTPQGGRHMVVRWVHRSSFAIRPPPGSKSIRLPMPSTAGPGPSPTGAWIVDPGWFGTVVVETEGTNEGLADLKARCRPVMPQRGPVSPEQAHWEERRLVYRILRERSRPGEICIRVVDEKERIIPP
ncbi:hypothetical protein BDW22DRAFT_1328268 [Trametopsis cervina]|nr:hypothetical protein BDW22DRAFT_1328268 [Trametopsis cervina]